MDEMQKKFTEEIRALRVENEIIWLEKGGKGLAPSTSTFSKPAKQP